MAQPVLYRTHPTKRLLDAIVVVPVDVLVDQREHLPTGALLPPLEVDGLDLHPAEETLRGRVVRRAVLRARRSRQPEPLHEFQPSRPPIVTAAVGTHQRTRALGQRGGRFLRHGVGELRVGAVSSRVGDCLAVVAVDHLLPGFQGDDGAPHTSGITGILRQPALQALPGRITEMFDHFGGRH